MHMVIIDNMHLTAGLLRLRCQGGCGGCPRANPFSRLPLQLLVWDPLCVAVLCPDGLPADLGDV